MPLFYLHIQLIISFYIESFFFHLQSITFEGFALICFHTSSITRIQSDSCSCIADLFFFSLKEFVIPSLNLMWLIFTKMYLYVDFFFHSFYQVLDELFQLKSHILQPWEILFYYFSDNFSPTFFSYSLILEFWLIRKWTSLFDLLHYIFSLIYFIFLIYFYSFQNISFNVTFISSTEHLFWKFYLPFPRALVLLLFHFC